VAANRALPLDLGTWAIEELSRVAGSGELRLRRNGHLRRAGTLIGGSRRNRAIGILRESSLLDRVARTRSLCDDVANPLQSEVRAAKLIAPIPAERQLRAILGNAADGSEQLAVVALPIANASPQDSQHEHPSDRPD
jgi:hypothetical protein